MDIPFQNPTRLTARAAPVILMIIECHEDQSQGEDDECTDELGETRLTNIHCLEDWLHYWTWMLKGDP